MSKCTLFFSRCACAILLALLSSIFAQASELDSVRTLNLDPNLVWDKISPNDYVLSKDGRTLVKWKNHSVSNLDMERDSRLSKVQFIGDGAFSSDSYSYSLETVVLASSVKSIGSHAFFRCSNLKKMLIPISVTSIGNSAFAMCSNLSRLDIPNSVSYIGEGAFSGCNKLKNIIIPPSVVTIRDRAFSDCQSLESVIIPSSVTSIGKEAFSSTFSDVLLNLRFESPKPPYVDDFIASEYSKIKIIVPKGAKEAYIKANLVANTECVVEE